MEIMTLFSIVYIFLIYCVLIYRYNYWKRRKIPGPKVNFLGAIRNHYNDFYGLHYLTEMYNTYSNQPVVGLFTLISPKLLVRDLNMIEDILVKNFSKFPNRGIKWDPCYDPMSENLFQAQDSDWKPLRKNLSPVFTSTRLKQMFDAMNKCTDRFIEVLNSSAKENEPIEFCELTGQLVTDILVFCFLGIDSNILLDKNSQLREIAPGIDYFGLRKDFTVLKLIALFLFNFGSFSMKSIGQFFSSRWIEEKDNVLVKIIENTLEHRRKSGLKNNDLLDFLMKLKDRPDQLDRQSVSDNLLLAQALFFIQAGLDNTPLTHAFYELALNPHVQDKLRNEIADIYDENEGKLDYVSIKNAKYLDKIVKEVFRKYPSSPTLIRNAEQEHTFHDTNISVCKGDALIIPVYAVHHDPKIYPDPDKFDPDRFDENIAKLRPNMSYLPFGGGPRICIAQRFVLNQVKLCLAVAVANFSFETCEKTFEVDNNAINNKFPADAGLYLRVQKI